MTFSQARCMGVIVRAVFGQYDLGVVSRVVSARDYRFTSDGSLWDFPHWVAGHAVWPARTKADVEPVDQLSKDAPIR